MVSLKSKSDINAVRRTLKQLSFVPITGLFGLLFGIHLYPPLDDDRFYIIGLILFFGVLFFIAYVDKQARRGNDVESFFPLTTWLALGPVLFASVLFLNGVFDTFPVESHVETITAKWLSRGRYSSSYIIEMSSWRPRRSFEKRTISRRLYTQFRVGNQITIELHKGALGIPWTGPIHEQ
jgi:hypothetical protein